MFAMGRRREVRDGMKADIRIRWFRNLIVLQQGDKANAHERDTLRNEALINVMFTDYVVGNWATRAGDYDELY